MSLFGVVGGVDGAFKAGLEDGLVGAFVETVVADWVDEDVGVCAGEAPKEFEVARCYIGRLGRYIGDRYVVCREVAVGSGQVLGLVTHSGREQWDMPGRLGDLLSCDYVRRVTTSNMARIPSPA